MRLLALLLSFFLLLSTLVPCSDAEVEAHSPSHAQEVVQPDHDHQDGEHSTEHCSPLCVCHCCKLHFETSALVLQEEVPVHSAQIGFHSSSFRSKEQHAIWRPPLA